jgi:hypothetical protein
MGLSVEVMPDSGAPQVGITVDGLDDQAPSVISVEVSWDDGVTWHGVRGAREITALGGTFVRDHVCPLNVEARYRLVVHSGAVTPSPTEATITVPSDVAWLQDPLAPRTAVAAAHVRAGEHVMLMAGTGAQVSRPQPVDRVSVEGARLPVASVGVRGAPVGVPVVLRALAQSQATLVKSLRTLFDEAGVVVLRGLPADLGLDPVTHAIAGEVREVPVVGGQLGLRSDWYLTVDQVRPPALSIVVPWWTYDQVKAAWEAWAEAEETDATYENVVGARPGSTYLDWLRDPTPEGA